MINLLPDDTKRQIRAARLNVLLVRYTMLLIGAIVFLAAGAASIYFVMQSIETASEDKVAENQAQISNYHAVEAEAAAFRANLNTARSILSQEVIYSDTVVQIAQVIPAGVVLDSISLTADSFGSPINLNAKTKSYQAAVNLKNSLENSSMFSDVRLSSVSGSNETGEAASDYPVSVSLTATLSAERVQR